VDLEALLQMEARDVQMEAREGVRRAQTPAVRPDSGGGGDPGVSAGSKASMDTPGSNPSLGSKASPSKTFDPGVSPSKTSPSPGVCVCVCVCVYYK
jgi:hypothetical protein